MPNGDPIQSGATFIGMRSKYKTRSGVAKVDAYLKGGKPPVFKYHRLWAQADIAIANASYGWLFPDDKGASAVGRLSGGESGASGEGRARGRDARTRLAAKKQK